MEERKQRERIKDDIPEATPDHPVRIIVATDTASQGIDLQDHCHRLVNYDIPFNPNRLEQRAGRIDRYGQHHRPQIFHFVGAQWKNAPPESADADLDFLTRVAIKVATMREDLEASTLSWPPRSNDACWDVATRPFVSRQCNPTRRPVMR